MKIGKSIIIIIGTSHHTASNANDKHDALLYIDSALGFWLLFVYE